MKKLQENQQVKEMPPKVITVKLKEAQEDESEEPHKPIPMPLKQAEENGSTESDHSEILQEAVLAGISGLCEGIDSYRPPDRKDSRFNKYLKDDSKSKRVKLIIKR